MPDLLSDFPGSPGATAGGGAFAVAVYALVSMYVLAGLAYLLSKLLSNHSYDEWAKNEFIQTTISAALVGGLFLLMAPGTGIIIIAFNSLVDGADAQQIPVLDSVISPLYGAPMPSVTLMTVSTTCSKSVDSGTVLCFAYNYLGLLVEQVTNLSGMLIYYNTILDIISRISIDVIIVQITPYSGISSIVQVINSAIMSLMFLGVMAAAQQALIVFCNSVALKIFLPIGVVLRCFFGTRRLGGALIAIAIGAYLIFPLTIAMNVFAVQQATADTYAPLVNLSQSIKALNPSSQFSSVGDLESPDKWKGFLGNYTTAANSLTAYISAIPDMFIQIISILVVQIVVLPFLSVMLTVIAIKELAGLFGSEVNLGRFEV